MKRPNLLLFMPETVRGDAVFGPSASRAKTPAMDRLASDGVAFTNAFCQMSYCTPSRCGMFTGLYPHTNGHRSIWHLLQRGERNLFQDLKEAGYRNVVFGKNDLVDKTFVDDCFDEYVTRVRPDRDTVRVVPNAHSERLQPAMYHGLREGACHDGDWAHVQSALQFLDEAHEQPWCLFLPLGFAHPWYVAEEPYFSMHDRDALPDPIPPGELGSKRAYRRIYHQLAFPDGMTEADCREIKGVYYGMISRVDAQLGVIMAKLAERNLDDDTVVVAFSDHGDYAGDYGMVEKCPYGFEDCMLHVPLIFRVPGVGERTVDALCEMTDLYPTLMELAGAAPQHFNFGCSLVPLLNGGGDAHRDAVFAEGGRLPDEEQFGIKGLAPQNWYAKRAELVRAEADAALSRCAMIRTERYKYTYASHDVDELFDLTRDPGEVVNVAERPEYAATRAELRTRLLQWMLDTSDTLPLEQGSRHYR